MTNTIYTVLFILSLAPWLALLWWVAGDMEFDGWEL